MPGRASLCLNSINIPVHDKHGTKGCRRRARRQLVFNVYSSDIRAAMGAAAPGGLFGIRGAGRTEKHHRPLNIPAKASVQLPPVRVSRLRSDSWSHVTNIQNSKPVHSLYIRYVDR